VLHFSLKFFAYQTLFRIQGRPRPEQGQSVSRCYS
jgi:hypothetical protein